LSEPQPIDFQNQQILDMLLHLIQTLEKYSRRKTLVSINYSIMKLNYFLFGVGIILITIGLWDYFYLRGLDDISNSEETQQLVPSIVGAVLLVFSPLFQKTVPKWFVGVLCFFLVLTAGILLFTIFTKPMLI